MTITDFVDVQNIKAVKYTSFNARNEPLMRAMFKQLGLVEANESLDPMRGINPNTFVFSKKGGLNIVSCSGVKMHVRIDDWVITVNGLATIVGDISVLNTMLSVLGEPSIEDYRTVAPIPLRCVKKPVEVQVMLCNSSTVRWVARWINNNGGEARIDEGQLYISTLEGEMWARFGDYVIRDVQGEFYPCKPDIFEATYDLCEGNSYDW